MSEEEKAAAPAPAEEEPKQEEEPKKEEAAEEESTATFEPVVSEKEHRGVPVPITKFGRRRAQYLFYVRDQMSANEATYRRRGDGTAIGLPSMSMCWSTALAAVVLCSGHFEELIGNDFMPLFVAWPPHKETICAKRDVPIMHQLNQHLFFAASTIHLYILISHPNIHRSSSRR